MGEHPALVVAARFGLPVEPMLPINVQARDVDQVVAAASWDRLAGLLCVAVDEGLVSSVDSFREDVRQLWQEQLLASVANELHVVRVAEVIDAAGVEWRLTKGPAVSRLDYPAPGLRTFGDTDLVVHPSSWQSAVDAIEQAGWSRELPELRPGFDDRFGKGATMRSVDGLELDLHRRLAIGRFGLLLPTEALFASRDLIVLAGRDIPTFDGAGRLVHACFHAALGGFRRLRAHRDVAQLLLVTDVEWERAVELAESHHVSAVLARSVLDAWAVLCIDVDHPMRRWASRLSITRPEARALNIFADMKSFRRQAWTGVPVLIGRGVVPYLYALTVKPGRK